MRAVVAAAMAIAFALTLSAAANAATITVNSLADPGAAGICALRDAITAANTQTKVNGCKAGSGNDTINFTIGGSIVPSNYFQAITDAQLTIQGPITVNNDSFTGGGGGIFFVASGATVKFQNLTIANQEIEGAFENEGTLTIANSIIKLNCPSENEGILTVTNSTFSGNKSCNPDEPGAIANGNTGTLTVTNSTFSNNSASGPGAISSGGTLTVTNSTFSDNSSEGVGAIDSVGTLTVINSTFSGNFGGSSAGAISNGGKLTVISSTFSGNMSHGLTNIAAPAGNINNDSPAGLVILKNSILANSTDRSGNPISNCLGAITDAGYNISDDASCDFSTSSTSWDDTNPGLSTAGLANNGGPTQTIALLKGSPAIDVIPLADCTDQNGKRLKTDQRGFPRPDAEDVCDIGAFETQDSCSQNQQGNNNCQ